jgi:hypothetical protein
MDHLFKVLVLLKKQQAPSLTEACPAYKIE